MDSRAVTVVLEKLVVVGLVVLFISGLGGALLGGAVPSYRASAAAEVGDRVLAGTADHIEVAVPATQAPTTIQRIITVPTTLDGETYRIALEGRVLHLIHADPMVSGSTRLALPTSLAVENASVKAGRIVVTISGEAHNQSLSLEAA